MYTTRTRRAFLKGMTATASAIAFSARAQEQGRNPTGLS